MLILGIKMKLSNLWKIHFCNICLLNCRASIVGEKMLKIAFELKPFVLEDLLQENRTLVRDKNRPNLYNFLINIFDYDPI